MAGKIPATVITGFLGAGKTTLVQHMLRNANGKRIALIINEFGDLGIDGDLLKGCGIEGCTDDDIVELSNGCICCTVEEEFLPVMEQLVARRDDIDHILIETSGLALPKPLVQAFNWPGIKEYCTVDAVITVVDGPAVAQGLFASDVDKVQAQRLADDSLDHDPSLRELLEDQLGAADLVIVSKNDLLNDDDREEVSKRVAEKCSDAVKTLYLSHGDAPLDLLMGINAATESRIDHVHNHHDHHHQEGAHHDHAHDHFDSHVITLGLMDDKKLQTVLKQLFLDFNIYRAKGFVALPNKPMRRVVQGVGKRLDVHFDRLWQSDETPKTQLVFIGKQLDLSTLTERLTQAELSPVASA